MEWKIEIMGGLVDLKEGGGSWGGVYRRGKVWYVDVRCGEYGGRRGIGEWGGVGGLSCEEVGD